MSNAKWCTKHSQYTHDCSDCAVLSALAPMADAVLAYRPQPKSKAAKKRRRKAAKKAKG